MYIHVYARLYVYTNMYTHDFARQMEVCGIHVCSKRCITKSHVFKCVFAKYRVTAGTAPTTMAMISYMHSTFEPYLARACLNAIGTISKQR